jgi:hypothetical protein
MCKKIIDHFIFKLIICLISIQLISCKPNYESAAEISNNEFIAPFNNSWSKIQITDFYNTWELLSLSDLESFQTLIPDSTSNIENLGKKKMGVKIGHINFQIYVNIKSNQISYIYFLDWLHAKPGNQSGVKIIFKKNGVASDYEIYSSEMLYNDRKDNYDEVLKYSKRFDFVHNKIIITKENITTIKSEEQELKRYLSISKKIRRYILGYMKAQMITAK